MTSATAWVYIRTFHGYIKIDIDTENQRNRRFSLTTTKLLSVPAEVHFLNNDIIFAGVMLQDARHAEKYMKIHDPFEIHNMRGNKFNLIINVYENHISLRWLCCHVVSIISHTKILEFIFKDL
ncbi:hypothetical protein ACJX0J_036508 [Zea mays]